MAKKPKATQHAVQTYSLGQITMSWRLILPKPKKWYLADWLAQIYRCSLSPHKPLKGLLHINCLVYILTHPFSGPSILTILSKRATTRLYFLKQLKRAGLSNSHLLHFYAKRPVLEYCAPVWHYALTKAQSESLEAIQKRAIHIAHNPTRGMPYSSMLYCTNIDSLASRREELSRDFFHNILDPASCLHTPQPPPSP